MTEEDARARIVRYRWKRAHCREGEEMDDGNDRLNRIEICLERLDATLAQIDKRVSDGFAVVNARLEGLENRLSHKAENWVVSLWGAPLGILVAAAFALVKLIP